MASITALTTLLVPGPGSKDGCFLQIILSSSLGSVVLGSGEATVGLKKSLTACPKPQSMLPAISIKLSGCCGACVVSAFFYYAGSTGGR